MKHRLIDDWRQAWRWWSVRLNILGATIMGWLLAFPDVAQQIWAALPPELKEKLPTDVAYWVPLLIIFGANVARVLNQDRRPPA